MLYSWEIRSNKNSLRVPILLFIHIINFTFQRGFRCYYWKRCFTGKDASCTETLSLRSFRRLILISLLWTIITFLMKITNRISTANTFETFLAVNFGGVRTHFLSVRHWIIIELLFFSLPKTQKASDEWHDDTWLIVCALNKVESV